MTQGQPVPLQLFDRMKCTKIVCQLISLMSVWLQCLAYVIPQGLSSQERILFINVTTDYNPISRPVRHAHQQVKMTFGVSFKQILELDGKKQILSSYVWVYEKWTDEHLRWSPDEFNGLQQLMFPATTIWTPDLYIFNVAGSSNDGFVNVSRSNVLVRYDGTVQWSIPLLVKSSCPVDATYFPYDKQACDIHFGSWIYDISQIDISLDPETPDLSEYVLNNEFNLDSIELKKSLVSNTCCPGDGEHPMAHLEIRLRRKTIYYDYIVIAPTLNLCVLTLATFLLPCECGWKIAIGLTVFLTLYVLQLLIAENVPDTNSTPLISVFLLLVMSLNCVSLIMATIIMNIKRRSQLDPVPRIPPLLLHICENYLSKIICTKSSNWMRIASVPREPYDDIPTLVRTSLKVDENWVARDEYGGDQYVPLKNVSSDKSLYTQVGTQEDDLKTESKSFRRTATAESSFSTVDSFPFIAESSVSSLSTDKLITTHASPCNWRRHQTENVNKSFVPETPESGVTLRSLTQVKNSAPNNGDRTNAKLYRNRPSYRRAVSGDETLSSTDNELNHVGLKVNRREKYLNKSPRLRRQRIVRFADSRGKRLLHQRSLISRVSKKYQWYFVADVIDSTTFLIYVIVMFVGILTVLVIVPIFA